MRKLIQISATLGLALFGMTQEVVESNMPFGDDIGDYLPPEYDPSNKPHYEAPDSHTWDREREKIVEEITNHLKPKHDFDNSTSTEDLPPQDANTSTAAKKKQDKAPPKKVDDEKTTDNKKKIDKVIQKFDPNTMPFSEGHFGKEEMSGGLVHYKPNFRVRISEHMAELAQDELLTYLQTYLNMDYKVPQDGEYQVDMFPIYTKIEYANLKVDPLLIDPWWFRFNFTTEMVKKIDGEHEETYISMALPLIESWKASADFTYYMFWIPIQDHLWVEMVNVTAYLQVSMTATTFGKVRPQIKAIKINFGNSDIYS